MSGGSLEYVSSDIEHAGWYLDEDSKLRIALRKLSSALHGVEWVMSMDWGEGDQDAAIEAALQTPVCDYKGFGEICTPEIHRKLKMAVNVAKFGEDTELRFAKHVYGILKAIHEREI